MSNDNEVTIQCIRIKALVYGSNGAYNFIVGTTNGVTTINQLYYIIIYYYVAQHPLSIFQLLYG